MGGDHKCPVCQATFTRPQHVARHMRSHTGDRPYKCQYCGDQFARSDLLSRHVNKCHANEKPLPAQGSRRKGSASASRATTSKQACDQCVQSSLPCDGANPCAKCIQRKCRCTFVKFHRQTAPVGPGHNPRPSATSGVIPGPPSSSRIPISYPTQDGFFLAPPPSSSVSTMGEAFSDSQAFSFPPLYPDAPHYTSKYRAQAELIRNNAVGAPVSAHFAPTGGTGGTGAPVGPGIPGTSPLSVYSDLRPSSGNSSWVSWSQEPGSSSASAPSSYHHQEPLHDKDIHHGHDSLSHRLHHHQQQQQHSPPPPSSTYSMSDGSGSDHGIPHDLQHYSTAAGHPYLRRGSVDFGRGGSDGSVPSSADSSSLHLPIGNLSMQQAQASHSLGYNGLDSLPDHRSDYASSSDEQGTVPNGALINHHQHHQHRLDNTTTTSFFPGMMNLGGGEGLPSLSGVPPEDPDATPMPIKENAPPPVALTVPMRSASASGVGGGLNGITSNNNSGVTPRDGELKELRDFWKQYMRTPFSGPSSEGPPSFNNLNNLSPQVVSPPGFRRPRVASMPSSHTPTLTLGAQIHQQQQQHDPNQGAPNGRTTLKNEDLRSYEAAVLARKAPTTLNLVPKTRRGTIANPPPHSSSPSSYHRFSASASPAGSTYGGGGGGSPIIAGRGGLGVVPLVKYDLLGNPDMRPGSSDGSGSSLAAAFGNGGADLHHQQQLQQKMPGGNNSPRIAPSQAFIMRRDSPVSTSSTTEDSSSRASSVSFDHDGDTSDDGGGASGDSGRAVERLRPSFKRLASTTLGPDNTKRAFLVSSPSPNSRATMNEQQVRGGGGGEHSHQMFPPHHGHQSTGVDVLEQGFAPGALGMH